MLPRAFAQITIAPGKWEGDKQVINHTRLFLFAATLASAILSAPVVAKELTGTLKKIKDTGVISLGHRAASIPFSYYDDKRQVIGYSQDLMLMVVEAVKADLKLEKLAIKLLTVDSSNRMKLIEDGSVDLECGSTTNNAERLQQVSFSNNIFVVETRLLTKADSGINDFSDLAGRNVVTTAGTTSQRLLQEMNKDQKMNMSISSAKDHNGAFLTLQTGRAVAFMMDDALLYGEMAKAKRPADWVVVGTPQSREAYACMMRKDDQAFKKVVDKALAKAMKSGEAEKIYTKWFMQAIPPKGLNLNFPLSNAVKAIYKSPNDKAFD